MEKKTELFIEAIETSQTYNEAFALTDKIKKVGNAVKNFFGTEAGAAQRANDQAQQNLKNAQQNNDAAFTNAQAMNSSDVAQKIIDVLNSTFKKDIKLQQKNDKKAVQQSQQKQEQPQEQQKEPQQQGQNAQQPQNGGNTNEQ